MNLRSAEPAADGEPEASYVSSARARLQEAAIEGEYCSFHLEEVADILGLVDTSRKEQAEEEFQRRLWRNTPDIISRMNNELPRTRSRRSINLAAQKTRMSGAYQRVHDLALNLESLLLDVIGGDIDAITDYLQQAVHDLLQAGQTTAFAIATLLEHGYLVDAEARWRGLYELTCQAALLTKTGRPDCGAYRLLLHGGRIPEEHPNAVALLSAEPNFMKDYQWLPEDCFAPGKKPRSIRQRDLFELANLRAASPSWVHPTHRAVHMSSLVVANRHSAMRGALPPGYTKEIEGEIAIRTAWTLYELVAHCCLLAEQIHHLSDSVHFPSWEQAFQERTRNLVQDIESLRPGQD